MTKSEYVKLNNAKLDDVSYQTLSMGEGDDDHFAELLSEIDVLKQAMSDMKDQVQFGSQLNPILTSHRIALILIFSKISTWCTKRRVHQ